MCVKPLLVWLCVQVCAHGLLFCKILAPLSQWRFCGLLLSCFETQMLHHGTVRSTLCFEMITFYSLTLWRVAQKSTPVTNNMPSWFQTSFGGCASVLKHYLQNSGKQTVCCSFEREEGSLHVRTREKNSSPSNRLMESLCANQHIRGLSSYISACTCTSWLLSLIDE